VHLNFSWTFFEFCNLLLQEPELSYFNSKYPRFIHYTSDDHSYYASNHRCHCDKYYHNDHRHNINNNWSRKHNNSCYHYDNDTTTDCDLIINCHDNKYCKHSSFWHHHNHDYSS
jgi:hypothetical protein